MNRWIKWAIIPVLLAVLVVGVILVEKMNKNPDAEDIAITTTEYTFTEEDLKLLESMTYEKYEAMTADEQYAFRQQFKKLKAFTVWYSAAEAEYLANRDIHEMGNDQSVDISDFINNSK